MKKQKNLLSPKQALFVKEYLVDLNATQAAIRAGYSEKTAKQQGQQNLTKLDVAAAVQAAQSKRLARTDITADAVLEEIRRIAFSDLRGLMDESGELKPLDKLTDEQAAAVASVEIVKRNMESGDGQMEYVHKIKLWDKVKGLEMLCRHLGIAQPKEQTPLGVGQAIQINVIFAGTKDDLANLPGQAAIPVSAASV